jgi:hypothetical protein
MRNTALLLAALFASSGFAQLEVDRPLQLEGPTPLTRQVTGLDTIAALGAVLTAAVEQQGSHRHALAEAGSVWSASIPALDAPQPGTHITIAVPDGAAGEAWLQVNGGAAEPLILAPGVPFDATGASSGTVLSLVHNGSAWQVMNGRQDALIACPPEMAAVNGQFCVERAQRPSAIMPDAVAACAAQGKRLCTWGEFVAACQRRTALGLLNPSSDWEWTGNSANEENSVRMVRLANCTSAGTRFLTGPAGPYRCCLSR